MRILLCLSMALGLNTAIVLEASAECACVKQRHFDAREAMRWARRKQPDLPDHTGEWWRTKFACRRHGDSSNDPRNWYWSEQDCEDDINFLERLKLDKQEQDKPEVVKEETPYPTEQRRLEDQVRAAKHREEERAREAQAKREAERKAKEERDAAAARRKAEEERRARDARAKWEAERKAKEERDAAAARQKVEEERHLAAARQNPQRAQCSQFDFPCIAEEARRAARPKPACAPADYACTAIEADRRKPKIPDRVGSTPSAQPSAPKFPDRITAPDPGKVITECTGKVHIVPEPKGGSKCSNGGEYWKAQFVNNCGRPVQVNYEMHSSEGKEPGTTFMPTGVTSDSLFASCKTNLTVTVTTIAPR